MTSIRDFDTKFQELSDALKLDKYDLDNQLESHGELYRQVGDLLALVSAERDAAEREMKLVEAEVDRDVREEIKGKPTETEVKRLILLDPRSGAGRSTFDALTLKVERLKNLRDAYTENRHGFNKLAELYASQYWNTQDGSRPSRSREATRERVQEAIASNTKRERSGR